MEIKVRYLELCSSTFGYKTLELSTKLFDFNLPKYFKAELSFRQLTIGHPQTLVYTTCFPWLVLRLDQEHSRYRRVSLVKERDTGSFASYRSLKTQGFQDCCYRLLNQL